MANPTWFNATKYLENKLAQLQATEPAKSWTAESLTKALEEAGYKGDEGAYKHFTEYGMNENISPNADFDVTFYLNAKAAQLNALNVDGKEWTAVSVMDAIKAAGMNSAWEHFEKYGSQEGVATSATFDTAAYFVAKTALMNKTAEGGRSDWSVDEVKAAFAEQGLNALEHYNLYGQAEFKAAKVEETSFRTATAEDTSNGFNPYTGVQTYDTLAAALDAQKDGSLAAKYAISDATDTVTVTVAQQAGLAALLAGATPAITSTAKYNLVDTVAALAEASTTVLTGSETAYAIADTLANAVAGTDGLIKGASAVTAKVAFGAKGVSEDDKTPADVVTTVLKYDDIDGKNDIEGTDKNGKIDLVRADAESTTKAEGKAEIVIDASATAKGLTVNVDDTNNALDDTAVIGDNLTYKFVGTAKADDLTVGTEFASIDAGAGNDTVSATFGGDKGIAADATFKLDLGTGDDTLTVAVAENNFDLGTDGDTPTPNANFVLNGGEGKDTLAFTNTAQAAIDFLGDDQLQGFETIDLSGAGLSGNKFTLCLNHQTEKFTINTADDTAQTLKIFSGQNADTITLGKQTTATIEYVKDTFAGMDVINGFGADDKIIVKDVTGLNVAADVQGSIASGVLDVKATNLKAALVEANTAAETTGEAVAFVLGDNSYVFVQNGDNDLVVELAGVNVNALSFADNAFGIATA